MHWLEEARIIVVSAYVCCSASLLIISIARRLQVRDVLHSSRYKYTRSLAVLMLVVIPPVLALVFPAIGSAMDPGTVAGYVLGSACWLSTSYINNSLLITKQGLVFPPSVFPSRLGWEEILDYFVRYRGWRQKFTIMWRDDLGSIRRMDFLATERMAQRIDRAVETRGTMHRAIETSTELSRV